MMEGLCREVLEGSYPDPLLTPPRAALACALHRPTPIRSKAVNEHSPYRSASGVEQVGGEMGVDLKGANEIHTAQTEKYLLEFITRGFDPLLGSGQYWGRR